MPRKRIDHATGIWINIRSHKTDLGVLESLVKTFKGSGKTIYDFGCGDAGYAKTLINEGVDVKCYDGSPLTPEITDGIGTILDLTTDFNFEPRDWVVCLEVGEHVPETHEAQLIDNITKHAKEGIVLSWAVPGQRGSGHVNLRDNDYIKARFSEKGFYCDIDMEKSFRDAVDVFKYFTWSLMVFRRSG